MTEHSIPRPDQARVTPLALDELSDDQRTLALGASVVIQTLARRGDLLAPWSALGTAVLGGDLLSRRDVELAILRVAYRTRAPYEWANHAVAAQLAGIPAEEIRAVTDESASWSQRETLLLRAADELCADDTVSDQTWDRLVSELTESGTIQLVMLIGFYRMTSGILNALGVEPEDGRPAFGHAPTEPASEPASSSAPAVDAAGDGEPDGTWDITLRHPAGDQKLQLTLHRDGTRIDGTVTNTLLGLTIPFTDGSAAGNTFAGQSVITKPITLVQTWRGHVHGDQISGECEVTGMGAYGFAGSRRTGS